MKTLNEYSFAYLEKLLNLNQEQLEIFKEVKTRHLSMKEAIDHLNGILRTRLASDIYNKETVLQHISEVLTLILEGKDFSHHEENFERK